MRLTADDIRRFWSKVTVAGPNDCWLYCGGWKKNPYGHFTIGGRRTCRRVLAHRVAFFIAFGSTDLDVCHTCDTPRCVNPAHLFAGTEVDNMQDCKAKGRLARGEGHGQHVLTVAKVIRIMQLYRQGFNSREIGERVRQHKQTVYNVVTGRRWSWFTGLPANG